MRIEVLYPEVTTLFGDTGNIRYLMRSLAPANAEFFAAVQGTCTVTASTVPFANAYKTVDIFKVALK